MNTKSKVFVVNDKYEYYIKYISIINAMLPVGNTLNIREIEVLACILSLDGEINKNNRFNTQARKYTRDKLFLSLSGMTNNIKALQEKKAIYINNYGILAVANVFNIDDNVESVFTLVIKPDFNKEEITFNDNLDNLVETDGVQGNVTESVS
jgi:hypothetical protein